MSAALRGPRLWVALGVLVAAVLTVATYLLVIAPARTEAASVQSQVDDATLQQTVLRHRLHDLDTASARMGDLQAALTAASAALPTSPDTPGLLRRVQGVADAAGAVVEHVTVKPSVATPVAGVWAVPVDLALLGPADALLATVAQLQADDGRLVTISASTLDTADGSGFRVSLVVQVYTTAPPTGDPAATAAGGATPAAGSAAAPATAGDAGTGSTATAG